MANTQEVAARARSERVYGGHTRAIIRIHHGTKPPPFRATRRAVISPFGGVSTSGAGPLGDKR
jgi:hypothetical protein